MNVNINSVLHRINELSRLVSKYKPDIISVQETLLINDEKVHLPGYHYLGICNAQRNGGVALCISNSLIYSHIYSRMHNKTEFISINIKINKSFNFNLISFYRYLNSDKDIFMFFLNITSLIV